MQCLQEFRGQGLSPFIACLRGGDHKRRQGIAIRLDCSKGPTVKKVVRHRHFLPLSFGVPGRFVGMW